MSPERAQKGDSGAKRYARKESDADSKQQAIETLRKEPRIVQQLAASPRETAMLIQGKTQD